MAPSKRRPSSAWNVERLSRLLAAMERVDDECIAQCHEAADRSVRFRDYWLAEANVFETGKRNRVSTIRIWIDYAAGKDPEMMK